MRRSNPEGPRVAAAPGLLRCARNDEELPLVCVSPTATAAYLRLRHFPPPPAFGRASPPPQLCGPCRPVRSVCAHGSPACSPRGQPRERGAGARPSRPRERELIRWWFSPNASRRAAFARAGQSLPLAWRASATSGSRRNVASRLAREAAGPRGPDQLLAVTDFRAREEGFRQRRRVVRVRPCSTARGGLRFHDNASSKLSGPAASAPNHDHTALENAGGDETRLRVSFAPVLERRRSSEELSAHRRNRGRVPASLVRLFGSK